MEGIGYFKATRNLQHVQFAKEFLEGMPRGIYDNLKTPLEHLIEAEWTNYNNCRKNHSREDYNAKVDYLRGLMQAMERILSREAKYGREGGVVEAHSELIKVQVVTSNFAFPQAVKAFIKSWAGVESSAAEAILDEAREVIDEVENLLKFVQMEDLMIGNIPNQETLRKPTDDYITNIIRKAEVEHFDLKDSTVDSEKERWEVIDEFLLYVRMWLKRIKISVKNYGNNGENPQPNEEENKDVIKDDLNV